jgi:hypothetical protein
MPRSQKPFTTTRRTDSKTFQLTLNPSCGLPRNIFREWKRKSFQNFPDVLAQYRCPKTKAAAEAATFALIQFLKTKLEHGNSPQVCSDVIAVGEWLKKFISGETSPRAARIDALNRPYSLNTLDTYRSYFEVHKRPFRGAENVRGG